MAGAAPSLAEFIVATMNSAVRESVASKADVAELKAALSETRSDLRADGLATRAEFKEEVAEVRADAAVLKTDVNTLKTGVATLKTGFARLDGNVWADQMGSGVPFPAQPRDGGAPLQDSVGRARRRATG